MGQMNLSVEFWPHLESNIHAIVKDPGISLR